MATANRCCISIREIALDMVNMFTDNSKFQVKETEISDSYELMEKYGIRIPVVKVESGHELVADAKVISRSPVAEISCDRVGIDLANRRAGAWRHIQGRNASCISGEYDVRQGSYRGRATG